MLNMLTTTNFLEFLEFKFNSFSRKSVDSEELRRSIKHYNIF